MITLCKYSHFVYDKNYSTLVKKICNKGRLTPNETRNQFCALVYEGLCLLKMFGFLEMVRNYESRVQGDVIGSIKKTKRKRKIKQSLVKDSRS